MNKKMIFLLLLVLCVILGVFFYKFHPIKSGINPINMSKSDSVTGSTNSNLYPFKRKWQGEFEAGTGNIILECQAVKDNILYINGKSALLAVNIEDGKEIWKYSHDPGAEGWPVLTNDSIVFAGNGQIFHSITYDGVLKWSSSVGQRFNNSPIAVEPALYFVDLEYCLYAIDLQDGKELWQFKPVSHLDSLFVMNDYIYATYQNRIIYCINRLNGELCWQKEYPYNDVGGIFGTDNQLFFLSMDFLVSINVKNGDELWKKERNIVQLPVISEGKIFVTCDGEVDCLDISSGQTIWTRKIAESTSGYTDMLVNDKYVFAGGGTTNLLYCLDKNTGKMIWCYGIKSEIGKPFLSKNNLIITHSEYGSSMDDAKLAIECLLVDNSQRSSDFTATINGKVVDDKNKPLKNAEVSCAVFSTKTDDEGNFKLIVKNTVGELNIQSDLTIDSKGGRWLGSKLVTLYPGAVVESEIKSKFVEFEVP